MNIIWHKRCATHWKQKFKFLSTPFSMPLHMRKDNEALQKLFALFFFSLGWNTTKHMVLQTYHFAFSTSQFPVALVQPLKLSNIKMALLSPDFFIYRD